MQIEKRMHAGVTVIGLSGTFDITEAARFEATFKELVKDKPKNVALDLNDVDYIDSSGIGALIKALNAVKAYGSGLILFGLKPAVMAVFKVAKLSNFFKILTPEEFRRKYPE